jgi:Zn-dependent protease with chaperone function
MVARMAWDLVLLSLAWELAVGCVLVGVALFAAWLGLKSVEAHVLDGRYAGRVGFHRFRVVRAQMGALLLLVLILVDVPLVPGLPAPESALPAPLQVGIAAICILATLALHSLLTAWLLTPRAWARMRRQPFDTHGYVAYLGRLLVLSYVPTLVFVEAIVVLFLLGLAPYRWLLPPAVALWAGLVMPFGTRIRAWLTGARPIEQTSWASLASRIHAWAKLAGVEVRDLWVDTLEDGITDNAVIAGPRRHALFLGAELLSSVDWRQRDAVIGHELGHAHFRHLPANAAVDLLRTVLAASLLMAALDPGFLAGLLPAFEPGAPVGYFGAPSSLLVLALAIAAVGLSAVDRGRRRRAELACDRFSANLTGDPLAMAVVLHTIITLVGYPLRQRSRTHPTFEQRQRELMHLLHLPGPRAPWAYAPVPSAIPFVAPPFTYTVPLDQAPAPAPVQPPPFQALPPAAPQPVYPVPYPPYPANPAAALYGNQPAGIYPPVPPYVPAPAPVYGGPPTYPGMPPYAPPPYASPPYPAMPAYVPAPGYPLMPPYPLPYPPYYAPYPPPPPYAALVPFYVPPTPASAPGASSAAPTAAPAPTPPAAETPAGPPEPPLPDRMQPEAKENG